MRQTYLRWLGSGMTLAAFALLLLMHATVAPAPVQASFCCTTCEANESACMSACGSVSHDDPVGDSVGACYQSCYEQLYEGPGACFLHCDFDCTPGPGDPTAFLCFVTSHGQITGLGYEGNHGLSCTPI